LRETMQHKYQRPRITRLVSGRNIYDVIPRDPVMHNGPIGLGHGGEG